MCKWYDLLFLLSTPSVIPPWSPFSLSVAGFSVLPGRALSGDFWLLLWRLVVCPSRCRPRATFYLGFLETWFFLETGFFLLSPVSNSSDSFRSISDGWFSARTVSTETGCFYRLFVKSLRTFRLVSHVLPATALTLCAAPVILSLACFACSPRAVPCR